MARSKYINTFNTTSDYNNYIESALPEFPNVGYDKEAGVVNIRRQSPNDYQIWGTTTATSNFNIRLNNTNVEVTVDPALGEFYLTGWTGTLTQLRNCFSEAFKTISGTIKKFNINTSQVTTMAGMFYFNEALTYINFSGLNTTNVTDLSSLLYNCTHLTTLDLTGCDFSSVTNLRNAIGGTMRLTDVYITVEGTLMKLTNNLTSQGNNYIPSNNGNCIIHYNDVDYKWQNNAWTPQS